MSTTHHLKTWPEPYDAVEQGLKTWEYRKNDRGFRIGDFLALEWWDPAIEYHFHQPKGYDYDSPQKPGVRHLKCQVTYILHGGRFGIPVGDCIMSIELMK